MKKAILVAAAVAAVTAVAVARSGGATTGPGQIRITDVQVEYKRVLAGTTGRLGDMDVVDRAYRYALARPPHDEERSEALAFLERQAATYPAATSRQQALTDLCHVLMCLNEFVYVD